MIVLDESDEEEEEEKEGEEVKMDLKEEERKKSIDSLEGEGEGMISRRRGLSVKKKKRKRTEEEQVGKEKDKEKGKLIEKEKVESGGIKCSVYAKIITYGGLFAVIITFFFYALTEVQIDIQIIPIKSLLPFHRVLEYLSSIGLDSGAMINFINLILSILEHMVFLQEELELLFYSEVNHLLLNYKLSIL